jgi:hypothetical protein
MLIFFRTVCFLLLVGDDIICLFTNYISFFNLAVLLTGYLFHQVRTRMIEMVSKGLATVEVRVLPTLFS